MRDLLFKCPQCASGLAFDRKLAGKELSCPACGGRIAVPVPDASFRCPTCDVELHVRTDAAGQFECPACKGAIAIEGEEAPPAAEASESERPKLRLKQRPLEREPEPRPPARQCPCCHAEVGDSDVLCVRCGTDLGSGVQHRTLRSDQPDGSGVALWSPNAASNWSIIFSSAFGAWIHAANWRALGRHDKAAVNMAFFWVTVVLLAVNLFAVLIPGESATDVARGVFLIVLLSWYFSCGRPQVRVVRDELQGVYRRRGWGKPLGIASACAVAYFLLAVLLFAMWGNVARLEKSAVPVVTDLLKDNIGDSAPACAAVKLGKKQANGACQATASLDDGSRIEITVTDKGEQVLVEIPDVVQYLVGIRKAAETSGDATKAAHARRMVAAHTRAMVRTCLTALGAGNAAQDAAAAMESVVGTGGIWSKRADLFREAGDGDPLAALDLYGQGVEAAAKGDYQKAIGLYERSARKDASFPWAFNNLAWLLATCPDTSLRNGPRAVEAAEAALDAVGTNYWSFVGTLAAAYAQCGDFGRAVDWQQKALASAPPEQREEEQQVLELFRRRETLTDNETPPGFHRETAPAENGPVAEPDQGLAEIRRTLHSAIIPEVEFRQADVADIVAFLNATFRERGPKGKAINIILIPRTATGEAIAIPEVTMAARHIAMDKVLDVVVEAAGCAWTADGNTVVIRPAPAGGQGASGDATPSRSGRQAAEARMGTGGDSQPADNTEQDPATRALLEQGLASAGRGDFVGAARSYRLAAERGSAWGQNNLGCSYMAGNGVPKDMAEGARWFAKAAAQGLREAQAALGSCYVQGWGVEKDVVKGARFYRRAAEQGDAVAQRQLCLMYAIGMGVPKSNTEAVRWARKAASGGDAQAKEWITKWDAQQGTHGDKSGSEASVRCPACNGKRAVESSCPQCKGRGTLTVTVASSGFKKCTSCGDFCISSPGSSTWKCRSCGRTWRPSQKSRIACSECNGTGRHSKSCGKCGGTGSVRRAESPSPQVGSDNQRPSLGHKNPWGQAGERVVGSYASFDAAYDAKLAMERQVEGNVDALAEQVINAGNATMTVQRPPEYRIWRDPDSRQWLLIEEKF